MENKTLTVIGICGGSGSGKSVLSYFLKEKISTQIIKGKAINVDLIQSDNYYHSYIDQFGKPSKAPLYHNFDRPEAVDLNLLFEHISALILKKTVRVPKFDFHQNQRLNEYFSTINGECLQILIVEGLFLFCEERLRNLFDFKIFIDVDQKISLKRRILRDYQQFGTNSEWTIQVFQANVLPGYKKNILPFKNYADCVVVNEEIEQSLEQIVEQIEKLFADNIFI